MTTAGSAEFRFPEGSPAASVSRIAWLHWGDCVAGPTGHAPVTCPCGKVAGFALIARQKRYPVWTIVVGEAGKAASGLQYLKHRPGLSAASWHGLDLAQIRCYVAPCWCGSGVVAGGKCLPRRVAAQIRSVFVTASDVSLR